LASAAQSAFAVQSVTVEQLPRTSLSKFAFVVVSDLPSLPAAFEKALTEYVQGGGGVLMALGTAGATRARVPLFDEPIRPRSSANRETAAAGERFLTVGDMDTTHPALDKAGGWSGVRFYYTVPVDGSHARVMARLTNGTPVLLEKKIGEGRVLLFASGLDNVTNDFPLHPSFVAFMEKAAQYLSGFERKGGSRAVDAFLELRTAQGVEGPALGVEIVDPEGRRPLSLTDAAKAQSFRLSEAGFYQVRFANGHQDVIGVNPDRRASNFEVVPSDVRNLWRGTTPQQTAGEGAIKTGPEEKQPYSLWWYVMVLVLVTALVESWLASRYLGIQTSES
jgi:hypothetical protein